MSIVRLVRNPEPGTPPVDRATIYISSETDQLCFKDEDGKVHRFTGNTGVLNVYKVVEDGAIEAPGVGLPAEQSGVRYVIKTNTTTGSLNVGWGGITNLQPNDIIQRSIDNTTWMIIRSATYGSGDILVYDMIRDDIYRYNGTMWISNRAEKIQLVNSNTTLDYDKVVLVDNSISPLALTLPTAAQHLGSKITIKVSTNSSNTVTINTTSGQTIDGAANDSISIGYGLRHYLSNGSNWLKI